MLLQSPEILRIESRFIYLFEQTFLRGVRGQTPSNYKKSVSRQFKSATFTRLVDRIIDDLVLFTVKFTDKQLKNALSAGLQRSPRINVLYASNDNPLPITEEAVKQADDLAQEVTESIIRMLKEDKLYYESPQKLSRIVRDIWGGQKYRADGFVRTFTADVAGATTLDRYKRQEIEEYQIYAKIDERTSNQCRILHGTIFKSDSPEARLYIPPFHHRCRTAILPITMFTEVKDSWRYENRDFSKPMNQDFSFSSTEIDSKIVKQAFKNIDTFNEKYRIDRWIFDEDLEKRYMRLGVGIDVNAPKPPVTKTPKVKVTEVPKKDVKKPTQKVVKELTKKEPKFVDIDVGSKQGKALSKEVKEKIKPAPKEVENLVRNKEIGIKDRKTEKAYIFDKDGKVVFEKSGNKTGVKFTTDELSKMKGNVLTHNHPNGTSFSSEDIKLACDWNLKEVRAIGNNNVYVMKMKDGSDFNRDIWDKKISSEFNKQLKLAENDHYDQLKQNKITIHEYTKRVYNQTWNDLSKNVPEIEFRAEGI